MNFNFLQIKLKSFKEEYEGKLRYLEYNQEVYLYSLTNWENKKLFGYVIRSIKMYFSKQLISVSYIIEISLDEYPDLLDCISLVTGSNPVMITQDEKSYLQWKSKIETLYCFPEYEKSKIQIYHTLNEYDIVG